MKLTAKTMISTLAVLLPLLASKAQAQAPGAGSAPGVIVSEAQFRSFPLAAEALGNARANESIEVRSEITAAITAIKFTEGEQVERGEVLVELENAEQWADLAAAKAALVESTSQLNRSQELFKTKVVSASQLEQLKAKQEADLAAVKAAQSRLDQTVIRAPFAGRLGLRRVSLGSVVDTNTVITTLDDTSRIKLDFDVPEVFISNLAPGLVVTARSAAWPDSQFEGVVSTIDTRVDPVSRTVSVRALLANEDGHLMPGMFLTVSLLKEDVQSLVIPEEAIVPERSRQFVFVVGDDNIAEMREITTGRRRPGEIEVLKGLEEGEWVIAEGSLKTRSGQEVRVISQKSVAGPG